MAYNHNYIYTPENLEFMYLCIGMYYIAIDELCDHISEKASTSCIRIDAAMSVFDDFLFGDEHYSRSSRLHDLILQYLV
jgi:hypothetical protein